MSTPPGASRASTPPRPSASTPTAIRLTRRSGSTTPRLRSIRATIWAGTPSAMYSPRPRARPVESSSPEWTTTRSRSTVLGTSTSMSTPPGASRASTPPRPSASTPTAIRSMRHCDSTTPRSRLIQATMRAGTPFKADIYSRSRRVRLVKSSLYPVWTTTPSDCRVLGTSDSMSTPSRT